MPGPGGDSDEDEDDAEYELKPLQVIGGPSSTTMAEDRATI